MPNSDLIVSTTAGRVRGALRGSLQAWRGIPYAAPPVGQLRFRAPRPAEPWDGVRETVDFGNAPPQAPGTTELGAGKRTPTGEDCLTINVTRKAQHGSSPGRSSYGSTAGPTASAHPARGRTTGRSSPRTAT